MTEYRKNVQENVNDDILTKTVQGPQGTEKRIDLLTVGSNSSLVVREEKERAD
jgi:hypothetical protein